jgi:tyrosyl-tRNA synthetase
VGINEPPNDMFGKLMSVSDDLMWRYLELLSFQDLATIRGWKAEVDGGANPRDTKVRLAQEIVARFHSQAASAAALEEFEARFRHGAMPTEIEECELAAPSDGLGIVPVLKQSGLCPSASDAQRMIEQGGVKVDGQKVEDKALRLMPGATHVVQVGKRKFSKVVLRPA